MIDFKYGGIRVREARPDDMDGIEACHAETEKILGKKMDLPEVSVIVPPGIVVANPNILLYLVMEDESGEIIGFHYQEKTIEMCHGGTDPRGSMALAKFHESRQTFDVAKRAGIRFIHCQVPKKVSGILSRHLRKQKFKNVSRKYKHFVLDLRD